MNGSNNVAEKVLDYWFTIEFLAQDKFPVQGLDSKKAIKEAKEGKIKRKTLSHFLLLIIIRLILYMRQSSHYTLEVVHS